MLEKSIERYLCKRIEALGGWCKKVGDRGFPDRMVLLPEGQLVFVELKRPGGKTTPLQDKCIARLKGMGFEAIVLDSKDKIDLFIEGL